MSSKTVILVLPLALVAGRIQAQALTSPAAVSARAIAVQRKLPEAEMVVVRPDTVQRTRRCQGACGLLARAALGASLELGGLLIMVAGAEVACPDRDGCDGLAAVPIVVMAGGAGVGVSAAARSAGDRPAWAQTLIGATLGTAPLALAIANHGGTEGDDLTVLYAGILTFLTSLGGAIAANYLAQ